MQHSIKLKTFRVPNYVIADEPPRPRGEGMKEATKFALHELDEITLEELCAEFRNEVMRKAKKVPSDVSPNAK